MTGFYYIAIAELGATSGLISGKAYDQRKNIPSSSHQVE